MPRTSSSRHTSKTSSDSSDSESSESSSSTLPMPTPPDGGYGWVIVAAAFVANLLADGVAFSFGVLLDEFLDYFHESKSKTSWIGSLFHGIPLICGPITCAFINKFGCRAVTIAGGFISSLGFILSFFAPNIDFLCVTFGLVSGFGLSMVYTPAVVIVAFYFEKKRAFASGLSVSGSGVGAVIFAPLTEWLIGIYGWRGCLLLIGGIMFNFIVCGALYRPLETKRERKRRKILRSLDKLARLRRESNNLSRNSLEENVNGRDKKRGIARMLSEPAHHSLITFPTFFKHSSPFSPKQSKSDNLIDEIVANSNKYDSSADKNVVTKSKSEGNNIDSTSPVNFESGNTGNADSHPSLSDPVVKPVENKTEPQNDCECLVNDISNDVSICFPNSSNTAEESVEGEVTKFDDSNDAGETAALCAKDAEPSHHHHHHHIHRKQSDHFLPLYRRDIFYRGSLLRIPSVREKVTSHSCPDVYQMYNDDSSSEDSDDETCKCHCRLKHIRNVMREMLDVSILSNPLYLLLFISNFILYFWFDIAYFFLPNYAIESGVSHKHAAMAISITGIANTLGQIFFGYIGDKPQLNTAYVYGAATAVCGFVSMFVPLCKDFISIWSYGAIYGFFIGANYSLVTVIIVKALLSLEKLTNAYGIIMCGQGIANLIGPPAAGYLYDTTGDYFLTFMVGGAFIFISGIMLFFVNLVKMCQRCCSKDKRSSTSKSEASIDIELKSTPRTATIVL